MRAACCVAAADGETTDAERELLGKLAKQTGVGLASLEAMVSRACEDDSFCNEQFRILKAEPKEAMSILLEVAMCGGVIAEAETSILRIFADKLDVPTDVFELLLEKAKEIAADRK